MNKTFFKNMVLAALMTLPVLAKAQTFAGITAEKNAQNTPEGWTAQFCSWRLCSGSADTPMPAGPPGYQGQSGGTSA